MKASLITEASNNCSRGGGGGGGGLGCEKDLTKKKDSPRPCFDAEVKESTNNIRVSQSGRHIFAQTEYSVDFGACGKVLWGEG